MKLNRKALHKERAVLDKKLSNWKRLRFDQPPRSGWIKAVRESIGMTTAQLAKRLGTSQPSVAQLESREPKQKITLESLEQAANALGCNLVYALVPRDVDSLQKLLEKRVDAYVRDKLMNVSHSMSLENQGLNTNEMRSQIKKLRKEVVEELNSQIWDEE